MDIESSDCIDILASILPSGRILVCADAITDSLFHSLTVGTRY